MTLRNLGRSNLKVPPLCFGGNVFGWTVDQAGADRLLDALMDAGLNFIDTADVYSRWAPGNVGGESETIIGRWLKARGGRERVVLATKVGMEITPDRKGLGRGHIRRSVDESLKRLQTDYIDLYQAHADDADTPLTETLHAFDELIAEGKVRAIGASNYSADRLEEALQVSRDERLARYETLQPHYNLYTRDQFEGPTEQACLRHELGVIPYYSLASGFLSGKYRSEADLHGARGGGVAAMLNPRGFRILEALDAVSAQLGARPAQVALAWLMAKPSIAAPIASATSLEQLQDLIAAARLNMPPEAIALLDQASA
ncbi:MAG: putative oxidoreductase, aryl-alcohol dehydrogenase like protein [Caulobacteraceae bacterium]|nr:putative oxidoreductase, aryl-alcohol dehydrogenase like protein [Caulobacteraceae bacterium]